MDYSNSKVIIIDDDSTTRRIVARLVKQIGFKEFIEAENGQQAYDLMQESDFDLILSDLDMPVMDGMELLEKVRNNERLKSIPFIMVTANDSKDNIMRAVKAHVSQYIVKPFTASALKEKIAKVLDQTKE